jgi:putative FmdB family regulatory protein
MPTYEYQCKACGHEFELFQQMSDSVKKKCPECSKLQLKRLVGSGSAVMFKGSGFYETDYRSESYKKDAKKADESSKPKKDNKKSSDSKKNSKDNSASSKKS